MNCEGIISPLGYLNTLPNVQHISIREKKFFVKLDSTSITPYCIPRTKRLPSINSIYCETVELPNTRPYQPKEN